MYYEMKCRNIEHLAVNKLTGPDLHFHNEIEIIINTGTGGKAKVFINGKTYELNKHEGIYIAPGQIHTAETVSPGLFWVYIFSPDYVPTLKKKLLNQAPENPVFSLLGTQLSIDIRNIKRYYWRGEYKDDKNYNNAVLISAYNLLTANLVRMLDFKENNTTDTLVQNVMTHISENYSDQLSVTEMAKFFNVPEYSLTRRFNSTTGITIPSFRNWIRVSTAAQELISTHKTVTEISAEVGFNSIRNFNNSFLKFYGITPTQYREKNK